MTMTSPIATHTSTISLSSQASSKLETSHFVQCLSKYKELLETSCDKILESCCATSKAGRNASTTVQQNGVSSLGSTSSSVAPITTGTGLYSLEVKARISLAQHLIELLASLVLPDPPQSIVAVDARLCDGRLCVPDKLVPSVCELAGYRAMAEKGRKKTLHLPVDKIYSAVKDSSGRFNTSTCIYIVAVVERIITNILQHAICYEEQTKIGNAIRVSTIQTLFQVYRDRQKVRPKLPDHHRIVNESPQDYDKCVDDLVSFLSSSLEQMNLILRIFREPVLTVLGSKSEGLIQKVFDDILDLYNNFRLFLDCLEADTTEDYSFAFKDPSRAFQTTSTSPLRPPSAQAYFPDPSTLASTGLNFSSTSSSPAPEHSKRDALRASSVSADSDFFQLDAQPVSETEANSPGGEKRRGRLVGRLLGEPAEDISMGSFMHYLSVVLDPECFSSAWKVGEQHDVVEALERLSRTVVHTVSKLKPSITSGLDTFSDPRWLCLHSFCCPTCRSLDLFKTVSSTTSPSSLPPLLNDSTQQPTSPSSTSFHLNIDQHKQAVQASPCNFLVNCFRYLLPRLLLLPIFQFFHLYNLVETLHQCAYDPTDCEFLDDVVDILKGTQTRLKSHLTRHTGLSLQFVRLICTGHVSVSVRSGYPTQPIMPAPIGRGHSFSGSLFDRSSALNAGFVNSNLFSAAGRTVLVAPPMDILDSGTTTPLDLQIGAVLAMGPNKAEEIDRLTGGKGRLSFSPAAWERGVQGLGTFVMEGRLLVREDRKRSASERHVYLFSNFLLICKRIEKRSNLVSSSSASSAASGLGLHVLRLKRRLPLEVVHVIDSSPSPLQPKPDSFTCFDGLDCHGLLHRLNEGSTPKLSSGVDGSLFLLEFVDVRSMPSGSTMASLSSASFPCDIGAGGGGGFFSENSLLGGQTGSGEPCVLPPGLHVQRIWFEAQNPEEKADWLSSLLSIQMSRVFDCYLRTLPKLEIPLRLPTPDKYRFSHPDTSYVIIFEQQPQFTASASAATSSWKLHSVCPSPLMSSISQTIDSECEICNVDSVDSAINVVELEDDVEGIFQLPDELTTLAIGGDAPETGTEDGGEEVSSPIQTAIPSLPQSLSPLALRPLSIPQIQFASIEKLVERLTYPAYSDVVGLNAFLLAYRRFLSAEALLNLLIERFNVPDPVFTPEECLVDPSGGKLESRAEHMLRRFRSGYKRRIQARVVMFLFRWVRNPRYFAFDFRPNPTLRSRLSSFLMGIRTRFLLPTVQSIEAELARVASTSGDCADSTLPSPYERDSVSGQTLRPIDGDTISPLEHCIPSPTVVNPSSPSYAADSGPSHMDLLMIHPLELATQVTLHEFDLYRRIKFYEVDGRTLSSSGSPNLDVHKDFSNKFRDWLVYSILSERHPDDRIIAVQRVIDLMQIFEHQHNMQGSQEAKSALISAAVFRLKKAFQNTSRFRRYRDLVQCLRVEGSGGESGKSRLHHQQHWSRGSSAGGAPSVTSASLFSLGALHTNSSSSGSSGGGGTCSSRLSSFPISNAGGGEPSDDHNHHHYRCHHHHHNYGSCSTLIAGTGTCGGRSGSVISDSSTGGFLQSLDLHPGRSNTRRNRGVSASSVIPHCGCETSTLNTVPPHMTPCVPFIAMNVTTPLIHLEVRHRDTMTTTSADGSTNTLINFAKHRRISEIVEGFLCHQRVPYPYPPDTQLQQALWQLDPFSLAGVSSEQEFEREMYKLSESYEPRESVEPVETPLKPHLVEVERRLTKEAIQAATYLTCISPEDKLTDISISIFRSTLRNSKVGRASPRISCSPSRSCQSSLDTDGRSLVTSIWQTRLQQKRALVAASTAASIQNCAGESQSRTFFSTAAVHQHSNSDSKMEKYITSTDGRFSASIDLDRLVTGGGDSMPVSGSLLSSLDVATTNHQLPPPPLPPRHCTSSSISGIHCASFSHSQSPSPLFHPETMREESLLPPLPPKLGARSSRCSHPMTTSSPVSPLFHNNSAQSSATSYLFHEPKLIFEIDVAPPPLPPRRHLSSSAIPSVTAVDSSFKK